MLPRALEPLARLGLDEHLWSDLAPVLDDVLAGRGDPYPVGELSETVVGGVAHAARAAGVRTWSMSMLTALDYARALAAETPVTDVELWSFKEGRTASVWRLKLDDRMIALNVARDDIAAAELASMGRELRELHQRDPLGVVDVLDIAPDVLACAWVEGRELHVVDRGDGRGLFIAVEELAAAANGRTLMLTGREGVPPSDTIWASWLEALVRQTTVDDDGMLSPPARRGLRGRPRAAQRAARSGRAQPRPAGAGSAGLGARSARPALGRARAGAPLGRARECGRGAPAGTRCAWRSRPARYTDRLNSGTMVSEVLMAASNPLRPIAVAITIGLLIPR